MANLIVKNNSNVDITWILNEKEPVNILKSNEIDICELKKGEYTIFTRCAEEPILEKKLAHLDFLIQENSEILEVTICGKNTLFTSVYFEWDWKEQLTREQQELLLSHKLKKSKIDQFKSFKSDKEAANKCSFLKDSNKRILKLQDNLKKEKLFIGGEIQTKKSKERLLASELQDAPIIEINTQEKEWKINDIDYYNYHGYYLSLNNNYNVYKFSDLISYEIIENNKTTYNSITTGGTGKAIVGGMLFGTAGAIVGGNTAKRKTYTSSEDYCKSLKIKVVVNDIENETIYIEFIKENITMDSDEYTKKITAAQELISLFEYIKHNTNNSKEKKSQKETVDDKFELLKKYKELLDMKIITKKEFEKEKNKILNENKNDDDLDELYTCDNCGADVREDDTICPNCGASFTEE